MCAAPKASSINLSGELSETREGKTHTAKRDMTYLQGSFWSQSYHLGVKKPNRVKKKTTLG